MATFIVRVQLASETSARYTILRDKLLAIGFTKRIKSQSGVEYRLPNGNYLIESNSDIETITNAVRKVALLVDRSPLVLVTEAKEKGNMWFGLDKC